MGEIKLGHFISRFYIRQKMQIDNQNLLAVLALTKIQVIDVDLVHSSDSYKPKIPKIMKPYGINTK